MSLRYARHFARIYNTPLLIAPHALDALLPAFERVLRSEGQALPSPDALVSALDSRDRSRETGLMIRGGVAVLPIHGVLLHRSGIDAECRYMLGYQTIAQEIRAALSDDAVKTLVLDIDSPGGEVAGNSDLVDLIRSAGAQKPIHASADTCAASAAYAIGAACSSLSLTKTAIVGSIGVVMRHVDQSAWLEKAGVKVTHIFAGARKVDGNPYEPLPKEVRARFQVMIDTIYGDFVAQVAGDRGMTEQQVRETEADIFMGQAAVDRGLADRVETTDAMIERLISENGAAGSFNPGAPQQSSQENQTMPITLTAAIVAALGINIEADEPTVLASIANLATSANAKAAEDARAEGMTAERERVFAILDHENAKGKMTAAVAMARTGGMTAETAGAVLATIEAPKPEANNAFAAAMNQSGNPDVGADEDEPDEGAAAEQGWDRALKLVSAG